MVGSVGKNLGNSRDRAKERNAIREAKDKEARAIRDEKARTAKARQAGDLGRGDTTKPPRGLIDSTLNNLDEAIKDALSGPASPASERVRALEERRHEGDQRERRRLAPPEEEEEEPELIPGDPFDFGARERRRRARHDEERSSVLRRGLLGV